MIETERLVLRAWREADRDVFHALGNDPDTMRYLGPRRTRVDDDAALDRQMAVFADIGTCGWAVERRSDGVVIGLCGIKPARAGLPIAREMEIGWRFAPEHRGQGYALEAARASLLHAWMQAIDRVFAITVPANVASWRLMDRIGMRRIDGGDFDHPFVAVGDPLRRHILYRMDRPTLTPAAAIPTAA